MQIFSYQPLTTDGPNGCVVRFENADPAQMTEIGEYNGRLIVVAPDAAAIPEQHIGIDWRVEAPSVALSEWISHTRYGQLLGAAVNAKHQARNDARYLAETGGFTFTLHGEDHSIDSDEQSILRISNAAAMAATSKINGVSYSVTWTCADDSEVMLDADGMLALQAALVSHGQRCHDVSQGVKANINAAETLYELDRVDVHGGY